MIDVIIPAYNCRKTIERCLGSLVQQTCKDFKLFLVNDCSTEPFLDLVEPFKKMLDITVIENKENVGCGMSRQAGIDSSHDEWFCFLDADDCFLPGQVQAWYTMIQMNPDKGYFISDFYREKTDENGNKVLKLYDKGFTWCHQKLYNREWINRFDIRTISKFTNFVDDSFFNSQCSELIPLQIIHLPLYMWIETPGSLTAIREEDNIELFEEQMEESKNRILRFKDHIEFWEPTQEDIKRRYQRREQLRKQKANQS